MEGTLPTPPANSFARASTDPTGPGRLENIFQNMAPSRIWSPHAVLGAQSNGANFAAYRGEHVVSKSVKASDEPGSGDRVVVHVTSDFASRIEQVKREEASSVDMTADMSRGLPTVPIRPERRSGRARLIVLSAAFGGALTLALVLFGAARARSESRAQGDSVHAAASQGDTPSPTTSSSPTFVTSEATFSSSSAYREAEPRARGASSNTPPSAVEASPSDDGPLAAGAAHRVRGALDGHRPPLTRPKAPSRGLSSAPRADFREPSVRDAPRGARPEPRASVHAKEGSPASHEGASPAPTASNSSSSSSAKFFPEERY